MNPVSDLDVESELSYAVLHAIASQAKASCRAAERLSDAHGIDATLTSWGPFRTGALRKEVDLKVQLKATKSTPFDSGTHLSYSKLHRSHYDQLRAEATYTVPRILVVLFLPENLTECLSISEKSLELRKSAYWVSLVGAPPVATEHTTAYLPKAQLLTPLGLQSIFNDLAFGRIPRFSRT